MLFAHLGLARNHGRACLLLPLVVAADNANTLCVTSSSASGLTLVRADVCKFIFNFLQALLN